jgi:hypothetical protein
LPKRRAGGRQNEDPVEPRIPAEGSGPSDADLLTSTVPEAKKRALDASDAEDVPGKKVWVFIDLKPSETDTGKSTAKAKRSSTTTLTIAQASWTE